MDSSLEHRRSSIIQRIRADFAGVSRAGGISWCETYAIDNHADEAGRAIHRAIDTDTSWERLVDDAHWLMHPGAGGFFYIDPIGMRYYLPAGLVRQVARRHPVDGWLGEEALCIQWALGAPATQQDDAARGECLFSLFTARQRWCVRAAIEFIATDEPQYNEYGDSSCELPWKTLLTRWDDRWCNASPRV